MARMMILEFSHDFYEPVTQIYIMHTLYTTQNLSCVETWICKVTM